MITIKIRTAAQKSGFHLFLMSLPLLILLFLFSYLPLYGWIYAFFDYHAGMQLKDCTFVGFKFFTAMFNNSASINETLRVLKNTFGMSALNILTSPLPVIFALFLVEIKNKHLRSLIQTLTTLPNFISWVIVYSIAWSMFSVEDGFINRLLISTHIIDSGINFLTSSNHVWLKMTAYGLWKGLGWSAILYIAAITSIDAELYEAPAGSSACGILRCQACCPPTLSCFFCRSPIFSTTAWSSTTCLRIP